jgi:tRNA(Ile)-lysidine synthase
MALPIGAAEFAAAMALLAPFERAAVIAVAVSGGRDSMALALLVRDWSAAQGGRAIAVTVDHGLRAGSAAEARLVGRRLRAVGMTQRILRWAGPHPASGVQAAARDARYSLLADWCRRHTILHLLLAHQQDDQAETLLMRLAHGSGASGLAAMPAVSSHEGIRLLRPLLGFSRARLEATLEQHGIDWVDDPSNSDPRFERVRWRDAIDRGANARRTRIALADAANAMGAARAARELGVADLLAHVRPMPEGYLLLPPRLLETADPEFGRAALLRCLLMVGGDPHPPRGEALERLFGELGRPDALRGRTLGGCRLMRWREHVLICREAAAVAPATRIDPGTRLHWDRRFQLRLAGSTGRGFEIRPLGPAGPAHIGEEAAARARLLPAPVRATLPALHDRRGLAAVPHLGWRRGRKGVNLALLGWQPRHPLAPAAFRPAEFGRNAPDPSAMASAGESCFTASGDYLE